MSQPRAIVRKLAKRLERLADRSGLFGKREPIHFLHLGKNAGTQIEHVAKQINARSSDVRIKVHSHFLMLKQIGRDERYFFSIRDPISRFRSAFYSRKRKGQPRYLVEWSPEEKLAFTQFEHANALAEALSETGTLGQQAFAAMKSIFHTTMNQADWVSHRGHFLETHPPVYIIRQEHFETDMRAFCQRLVGYDDLEFAADDKKAHRNHYDDVPALSDQAQTNLKAWYAQDIAFYSHCEAWIKRQQSS